MKFEHLLHLIGNRGVFDLATVTQLSDDSRRTVRTQLHRWSRAGKLIPLRRGMYALASRYRRTEINPAVLANSLYTPSYLSLQWALGYFGLIPEKVVTLTSVSTRQPRRFRNEFGTFRYRTLRTSFFFGYRREPVDGQTVMLAEPEKALLDFWYLEKGEWLPPRMSGMRFQNAGCINERTLREYARRWRSPRLTRAVDVWSEVVREENRGSVEL